MALFPQIETPVKKILNELMGDASLAETVTYRKFAGQTFNPTEGHNVDLTVDYDLTAVRLRHNLRSVQMSSSPVEQGDQYFLFRYGDLPATEVSLKDKIIDAGGKTYSLKAIDKIFGLAITVTVDGS